MKYTEANKAQPRHDDAQDISEMKFFRRIRAGIDVAPLLQEIAQNDGAWLADTSRQDNIQVQRDTNTIFLKRAVRRPDLNINENQESELTTVSKLFPQHQRGRSYLKLFFKNFSLRLSPPRAFG